MNPKPENPSRWETVVIAASFLVIWGWYLSRQGLYKAGLQPTIWHSAPLLIVLFALGWVFVRRVRRVVNAMREQKIGLSRPRSKK
ncbi:hypothetical protein IAD21_04164 [Abditibacteriota bacterium]|nr:hypothetical protein IAD21_04164 [Abditibacteriota bacterium]